MADTDTETGAPEETREERLVQEQEQLRPHEHRHPSPKEYIRIALILAFLTGVEVAIYYVRDDLGGWYVPMLFVLGVSKFSLVVMWFMHLKFDSRTYARFFVMGIAGAISLYTFVLLMFRIWAT